MRRPTDAKERKQFPLYEGVLRYFPDALLVVANVSYTGNEQHHPGEPLHWDKSKSTDEADALMRHLLDRGTLDGDGLRHTAKVAWRALALLQRELDAEAQDKSTMYVTKNLAAEVAGLLDEPCPYEGGGTKHAETCPDYRPDCRCFRVADYGHQITCPLYN